MDGACTFCSVIETYPRKVVGTKKGAPFKPFIPPYVGGTSVKKIMSLVV
jgi:hypothetical protein